MAKTDKRAQTRDDHQLMEIERPEPLVSGQMTFGLVEFVQYLIDTQPQFTRSASGLRAGVRIEAALGKQDPDEPLVLEWRDVRALQGVAEEPAGGYPLRGPNDIEGVNRKVLVCVDAVMEAEEVPPPSAAEGSGEQPEPRADSND